MLFEKTYKIESGPDPMSWIEYKGILDNTWRSLLKSNNTDERAYQDFLECHPCYIPGPFGLIGTSGHTPYPSAVISQPFLPDYTRKVPDFMWIARNSTTIYPILIEIESPSKKFFNSNETQNYQLTQAREQITDWMSWFSNPLNVAKFKEYYDIEMHGENIHPLYLLIYGRRAEANRSKTTISKRSQLTRNDEFIKTYDSLSPQKGADEFYTVKRTKTGYEAMYIPPTSTLGPVFASERALIKQKDIAIKNSPYISDERREFLLSRTPYWDQWADIRPKGIIQSSDYE